MNTYIEYKVKLKNIQLNIGHWKAKGTTIIALHGLTGNHKSWKPMVEKLHANGYNIIAPDLRGRGKSDKPKGKYGLDIHVKDLKQFMDTLNLEKVVLLGHSYGCMISIQFTIQYPEFVQGMILMDGGGRTPFNKKLQILSVIKNSFQRLDKDFNSIEEYCTFIENSKFKLKMNEETKEFLSSELEYVNGKYRCSLPLYVVEKELNAMGGSIQFGKILSNFIKYPKSISGRMKKNNQIQFEKILSPTLIMKATRPNIQKGDDLLPKKSLNEMLNKIPNSESILLDGNHYEIIFKELKNRDDKILEFLTSVKWKMSHLKCLKV